MSYSCRSVFEQVDAHTVDEGWRKCEEVLTDMSSFSVSARHSLQFLQVTHQHIVQSCAGKRYPHAPRSSLVSSFSDSARTDVCTGASRSEGSPGHGPGRPHPRDTRHAGRSDPSPGATEAIPEETGPRGEESGGPSVNPFMSWDEMGLGQEEFGFLGRFDLPDLANWFTDIPDIS